MTLCCLASRPVVEWAKDVDAVQWARTIVERWSWSKHALEGLVELINVLYDDSFAFPFTRTIPDYAYL